MREGVVTKDDLEAFRRRFSEWLERNSPDWWPRTIESIHRRIYDDIIPQMRAWQRRLYEEGWLGYGVPERYGGKGGSRLLEFVIHEELAKRSAAPVLNRIGLVTALPILLSHGTDAQRERYVPPILRADEIWCQGFSEPSAGSDLAVLACRGEIKGDSLIISGQKVWSSLAHIADYCLLLCRTGKVEDRHRSITCVILPMKSEGVRVSPIKQITGETEFNQIFLSEVRVPLENVIGELNQGWNIAMMTLNHERLLMCMEMLAKASAAFNRFRGMIEEVGESDKTYWKARAVDLLIDLEKSKALLESMMNLAQRGEVGPETTIMKLSATNAIQRTYLTINEYLGGGATSDADGCDISWFRGMLWSRGRAIAGGTSEVLRNIISERILEMPR
ncbi:MAG: acyl-CoA dehydrogenase family protein [Aigarchaeota archaeon]|nr:acyl-CoA dehydrogenase family protein [Aigarchaeota archaeon]MDW8092865.1 acyl-CoA dehydrogenase family protein [Nitrososphaerota archaeon]